MMDLPDDAARARRRLPVLICLAALALLASVVPAVAATGSAVAEPSEARSEDMT